MLFSLCGSVNPCSSTVIYTPRWFVSRCLQLSALHWVYGINRRGKKRTEVLIARPPSPLWLNAEWDFFHLFCGPIISVCNVYYANEFLIIARLKRSLPPHRRCWGWYFFAVCSVIGYSLFFLWMCPRFTSQSTEFSLNRPLDARRPFSTMQPMQAGWCV